MKEPKIHIYNKSWIRRSGLTKSWAFQNPKLQYTTKKQQVLDILCRLKGKTHLNEIHRFRKDLNAETLSENKTAKIYSRNCIIILTRTANRARVFHISFLLLTFSADNDGDEIKLMGVFKLLGLDRWREEGRDDWAFRPRFWKCWFEGLLGCNRLIVRSRLQVFNFFFNNFFCFTF